MSDPIPLRAEMAATRTEGGLSVQVDGVDKRFGEREVLRNTSLRLAAGQFGAIVGRSGCGKSTLLRLVAGLDAPDSGRVRLDGRPVAQCLDDVRIMFQDPRLLPWKTVHQNVMLGLDSPHASELALQALHDVALADRAAEWPSRLSGGQRQRVALARALVHRPKLLLLDEPLGALDALTRLEMHRLIEHLWRSHGFTALLVTHDVAEAVALADRVLLVEHGQVTMDEAVRLPRPRERASAARVALEARVLERVLQPPAIGAAAGGGVGVG